MNHLFCIQRRLLSPLSLLLAVFCVGAATRAEALTFTAGPSLSDTTISFETNGTPNGTTIQFTLDKNASVQIDFFSVSPVDSSLSQVAALNMNATANISTSTFWNGLWLIGDTMGRRNGTIAYRVVATTTSESATLPVLGSASSFLQINSVDIHSLSVTPSLDASGAPTFPYRIQYSLAKAAQVTATITNSSNTVVRHLATSLLQYGESVSTSSLTWDGLGDNGKPVSIGVYTLTLDAADPNSADRALTRTASIAVTSLAGAATDAQKLFEDNVFVYPNPVRNGLGTFQMEAIREGANLTLKIYTLTGDLVREQSFPGIAAGNIVTYDWDATNQSGQKVGRGLYYYVVREEDSAGTLQTVKKLVVLP